MNFVKKHKKREAWKEKPAVKQKKEEDLVGSTVESGGGLPTLEDEEEEEEEEIIDSSLRVGEKDLDQMSRFEEDLVSQKADQTKKKSKKSKASLAEKRREFRRLLTNLEAELRAEKPSGTTELRKTQSVTMPPQMSSSPIMKSHSDQYVEKYKTMVRKFCSSFQNFLCILLGLIVTLSSSLSRKGKGEGSRCPPPHTHTPRTAKASIQLTKAR